MRETVHTAPPTKRLLETSMVFVVILVLYSWLLSAVPVDDVARYVAELKADKFFWDLGHVWIQPLALLLHRLLGQSVGIMRVLETMNVFSVALGIAIFFDTLRCLGHSSKRSALAALLAALSFNLIALGPTGHIKLLVFPTLAMTLRHATLWESAFRTDIEAPQRRLWASGIWLGIGANLLVSILPMAVFVAPCIAIRVQLRQHSFRLSTLAAARFMCGTGCAGLLCLLAAYFTAKVTGTTHGGFIDFVFHGIEAKEDLRIAVTNFVDVPFRFAYSLIYNFAYLPELGSLGRAAIGGLVPNASEHLGSLTRDGALALFSGAVLAAIAVTGVRSLRERDALLLPFGFVAGATAFSAYYNLNDPEHWFQFTLPVLLIGLQCRRRWLDVALLAIWLPWLAVNNMALYGIPKARFAYEQRQIELREALGPQGLYVGFAGYPGEPDTSLFALNSIESYKLDVALTEQHNGDVSATLEDLRQHIDTALARGGKVLLFRALDADDWRGPVITINAMGMTKARIKHELEMHYALTGPESIAGFPAWSISNRNLRPAR